jgi:DNA ligase 1
MRPGDKKRLYDEYRQHVSKETKDFIYMYPRLQGIVKYRNLTSKGYLRIASFEKWIS